MHLSDALVSPPPSGRHPSFYTAFELPPFSGPRYPGRSLPKLPSQTLLEMTNARPWLRGCSRHGQCRLAALTWFARVVYNVTWSAPELKPVSRALQAQYPSCTSLNAFPRYTCAIISSVTRSYPIPFSRPAESGFLRWTPFGRTRRIHPNFLSPEWGVRGGWDASCLRGIPIHADRPSL